MTQQSSRPTSRRISRRTTLIGAAGVLLLVAAVGVVVLRLSGGSAGDCSGRVGQPGGADAWGGCWPGADNTGVPAGTRLTRVPEQKTDGPGWRWNAADRIVEVDEDGATLERLDVDGGFYVRGIGVTIRDSRARFVAVAPGTPANYCHFEESRSARAISECTEVPGLSDDADASARDRRTRVEDSEIDYRGRAGDTGTCISARNLDLRRLDIHGCENGLDADSYVSLVDSYVHDLYNSTQGDPHTDGLQSGLGAHLRLDHNVFYGFTTGCTYPNDGSCNGTSAINIGGQPDVATVRRTSVTRNLLAGGAYTIYCPVLRPDGFVIRQNYFSTVYTRTAADRDDRTRVGEYGPQSDCDKATADGNELLDVGTGRTTPLPFTGE